jgi:very-short-patch-repair endonuclease
LRALRTHYAGADRTASDLEILFKELCRAHGLPVPRVNHSIAGKEVDFLFADARLIVETDSWRYHKTRRAFEDDRARDVLTTSAGYRMLRFTDRQLERDPHTVAAAIARVLADRRAA